LELVRDRDLAAGDEIVLAEFEATTVRIGLDDETRRARKCWR